MCDYMNKLLKSRELLFRSNSGFWEINKSHISGYGVFATQDFREGDVVFEDFPMVLGPRSSVLPPTCVSCMKLHRPLKACSNGCRLPVCSNECENSTVHTQDCQLLRDFSVKKGEHWAPFLYRALTPFRCLSLNNEEKEIIQLLSANKKNNFIELTLLKNQLEKNFSVEEEEYLKHCCGVLNGTAFETEIDSGPFRVSLRGLYPIAGMMNHSCVPNTQHFYKKYNNSQVMVVLATVPILKGDELMTHYCPLLWSTIVRRHYLYMSKEFECTCQRCRDPTEFGTNLGALKCLCKSVILPLTPLNIKGDWKCTNCGKLVTAQKLISIKCNGDCNSDINKMNYDDVQNKLNYIWRMGHGNNRYSDLSDEELNFKEYAIKDILSLNQQLKLGESRIKGLLCFELYETLMEKKNRNPNISDHELMLQLQISKNILKLTLN